MKNILIIVCVLVSLIVGCEQHHEPGTVVATVNGVTLTLEELRNGYADGAWDRKPREEQRAIINQWVDLTLLSTYAKQNEVIRDDLGLKFKAKNAEKKLYSNALISNELNKIHISNEELYNYYRLRQADFIEPIREFRVQRIFFRNEADMNRINGMITDGRINFTPAAEQFSEEGIGRNGGHMSTLVTKAGPDSLLWEALNVMERFHRVTVPYRNGWIIARWQDYRMATASRSFFDVREDIEKILRNEKRSDLFNQLLREARMMSDIVLEF